MAGFLFRVVRKTLAAQRLKQVAYLCPVWIGDLNQAKALLLETFATGGAEVILLRSLTEAELRAYGLKQKGDWTYDPEAP